MWQVLVMVCFLTAPCQYFVQSPPEFYKSYDECIEVANFKSQELTQKFKEGGYTVVHAQYTCIEDSI
jgi:hypothetical protein